LYKGRTRQAELTADNGGSRSTGAIRLLASMTWFNPNDIADMLNIVAVHTRGSDYARLAYSIPVGTDGWRMGMNVSSMNYEVVVGEQGMVGAVGRAITQGLELVYPLLRSDQASATVTLSADEKEFKNTSAQGLLMSDYSAKVLSAQVAGFYRDLNPGGGTGTYSVLVTHGDLNLAGSLNQQTDMSGHKTAGSFNKVRVNGTWQQALTTQTSAFVSHTGQLTDKNLDSSEKMQLGGMNGVRAFGAESIAYQSGANDVLRTAERDARVAAFGAIRRAAKVARSNDKEANMHGQIVRRMVENDPDCIYVDHSKTCSQHRRSQYTHRQRAESVRFAIRAAIKSPWLIIEPHQSRREP
jgi:hemolysin activation/secretion protein